MQSSRRHQKAPGRLIASGATLAAALLLTACGADNSYKNTARPPAPIVVSASIGPEKVSVSPRRFGAGPVRLIITNQTEAPQQVTFKPAEGKPVSAGPINPGATATVNVDVPRGKAMVKVGSSAIAGARVIVGAERASAQDDLLQP